MHELSVAMEVCRLARNHLEPDEAPRLVALGLDVGDEAGIVVDNLEFCLETLLAEPPFGRARPEIDRLEGDVLRITYLDIDESEGSEDGDSQD